jgi:hypothetical protein
MFVQIHVQPIRASNCLLYLRERGRLLGRRSYSHRAEDSQRLVPPNGAGGSLAAVFLAEPESFDSR